MNRFHFSNCVRRTVLLLVMVVLIALTTRADAAYRITRPITENDGHIRQDYLYGEGAAVHKGVDFSVVTGTSVHAVADGIVRQVIEQYQNGCRPGNQPPDPQCPAFGNLILVRHNQRHFDSTTGQMAYVYSLYAHLSQWGALVNENDNIVAGQIIGQSDDTGNSSGPHFHLQIMISPDPNQTVVYPLTWTESNSRNPELWLTPYNGNTGTVVGKVTNVDGNPVGGLLVYGLQKQAGWGYGSSQTYITTALKPDDILVENWGTTDVTPGTYTITLSNGSNMGRHTVQAGQITYVGLYPVWLPEVRNNNNNNGWISTITVRNNSSTFRAQVNTTFFNTNGTVQSQRTDYVSAKAIANLSVPANWLGSALVVSSEDISVIVRDQKGDELSEYNGILASGGSPGWEQVGSTVYTPIIKNGYGGRSSRLLIANAGTAGTTVTAQFYNASGGLAGSAPLYLPVNGSGRIDGSNCTTNLCSAKVWSDNGQPLAVAILERADSNGDRCVLHGHRRLAEWIPRLGGRQRQSIGRFPDL
jgi:murein DD-endopeptidase MepM/ murein hydrolase activator NlpD